MMMNDESRRIRPRCGVRFTGSLAFFTKFHRSNIERMPGSGNARPTTQLVTTQEAPMKKLIALAALAFVVAAGTVTVMTVHPQPAMADGNNCSGC